MKQDLIDLRDKNSGSKFKDADAAGLAPIKEQLQAAGKDV